ncbi:EAL domain-containing protein [Massilia sp. YIM B02763]|uniref:putative bifunctional diguanylate cyclase/phosphodiesterase n=1 Tax=Massilia sp. YIM B02763 TaxID=3050130 RepID=UPI0025B7169A|nr:EAL domain-containing protein [Massilia sp. YIM B02763]MDN4055006.1 EAL domain-containing protein [Massilia sp. YIM B02763]
MPARTPGRRRSDRATIWSTVSTGQVVAVVVAMLVAGIVVLVYQYVLLRQAQLDEARVQAGIIADNVTAPLMFCDRDAAAEMLRPLRYAGDLVSAAVDDADGRRFVGYVPQRGREPGPLAALLPGMADAVRVSAPVEYRGRRIGKVDLVVSTAGVRAAMLHYMAFLALTVAGAVALVIPILRRTRSRVAQAERELDTLAHTDPVTGLPNRRATYLRLEREMTRPHGVFALLLIDLDNFKTVNDTAGHAAGDELLRAVAKTIGDVVGDGGLVGRIGGDEFAVILAPVAQRQAALDVARAIVGALSVPFVLEHGEVLATASIGMCVYPDDAASTAELVSSADTALYRAKHAGRNQVVDFRPEMTLAAQRRACIERELRKAIAAGALEVHYQPQFESTGRRVVGVEALVRWNHPDLGAVAPAEFIPVAEETGMIVALGTWVLRRACRDAAGWRRAGLPALSVAVNVSARQMREPAFVADVLEALADSGLPAAHLELELTESMLMEKVETAIAFMQQIRAAGVRLSIDDFGTGYSSLAYLQAFPINQLKIDRSFVRLLPRGGEATARAIIALARGFGLTVLAEGVEERAQLDWLHDAGCEYVQGFLLGRPMPADALAALLAQRTAA